MVEVGCLVYSVRCMLVSELIMFLFVYDGCVSNCSHSVPSECVALCVTHVSPFRVVSLIVWVI